MGIGIAAFGAYPCGLRCTGRCAIFLKVVVYMIRTDGVVASVRGVTRQPPGMCRCHRRAAPAVAGARPCLHDGGGSRRCYTYVGTLLGLDLGRTVSRGL